MKDSYKQANCCELNFTTLASTFFELPHEVRFFTIKSRHSLTCRPTGESM